MVYTRNYSKSIEKLDSIVKKMLNRFTPEIYQGDLNVTNLSEVGNAVRKKKKEKSMQQLDLSPAKIKKHPLRDPCLGL